MRNREVPFRGEAEERRGDTELIADVLLSQSKSTRDRAWALIEKRHRPHMEAVVDPLFHGRTEDVHDAVRWALEKALGNLSTFRGDASLKTWLQHIAKNTALQMLKRHYRKRELADRMPGSSEEEFRIVGHTPDTSSFGRSPEDLLLEAEGSRQLESAIADLPPKQRQAFLLMQNGIPTSKIAEKMGTTTGAISSYIFKARRALLGAIEEGGEEGKHVA